MGLLDKSQKIISSKPLGWKRKYRAKQSIEQASKLPHPHSCHVKKLGKEGNRTIIRRDAHTILVYKCQVVNKIKFYIEPSGHSLCFFLVSSNILDNHILK